MVTENEARIFRMNVSIGGTNACWEYQGIRLQGGHGLVRVGGRNTTSNRAAWVLWRGEIPEGLWVLHTCDNGSCCNPHHLYLGDRAQNIRDRWERRPWRPHPGKSLATRGRRVRGSRFTEDAISDIRQRHARGVRIKDLADQHGVGWNYIYKIVTGRVWSDTMTD